MIDSLNDYINEFNEYTKHEELTEVDLLAIDKSIQSLSEHLKKPIETHSLSIDRLTKKLQVLDKLSGNSLPKIQEAVMQLEQFKEKASLHLSDKSSVEGNPTLSNKEDLKRILFQFVADSFGQNSSLEGMAGDVPLKYLQNYLKFRKSNEKTDPLWNGEEMKRVIDQAIELDSSKKPEEFQKQFSEQAAKAWDAKQPMLIRGGWTAVPYGHTMYYLLIPMPEDQKWNLRLYNVGGGVQFHGKEQLVGLKEKVHEVMEWEGIKKDKINESFAKVIYEFIKYPQNPSPDVKCNYLGTKTANPNTETRFSEEDIYKNLRSYLEPDGVKKLDKPADMSPQHAGVCSWKSLLAFMRNQMDETEYRLFKCEIQQQILLDNVKSDKAPDIMSYTLVKKGYEKLNRYLHKLEHEKVLSEKDISQIPQALEPIKAWLDLHKDVLNPKQNFEIPTMRKWDSSLHSIQPSTYTNDLAIGENRVAIEAIEHPLIDQVSQYKFDAKTFKKDLETLLPSLETAWKREEDLALNMSCVALLKKIPLIISEGGEDKIDEALFKEFSQEDRQEVIKMLGKVGRLFFKSCITVYNAEQISPERIYVLIKITRLQEVLSKDLGLGDFRFWQNPFKNHFREKLFAHVNNQQVARELGLMMNREESSDAVTKSCSTSSSYYCINHKWETVKSGEKSFFDLCCFLDSSFKEKFIKEYPDTVDKYNNFKVAANELAARAYGSKLALPEWLRAMRDNYDYSLWLTGNDIFTVPLDMVDRDNEASQDFLRVDFIKEYSNDWNAIFKGPAFEIVKAYDYKQNKFENLFRKINSKDLYTVMREIARGIIDRSSFHEKSVLTQKVETWQLKLTKEEIQELLLIKGSNDLWGVDTLSYFTKHPEKLKDPDYQTLFKILIFPYAISVGEFKNLYTEIKENPTLGKDLSEFLRRQYILNNVENETETCLFLLKMMSHLSSFCPDESFMDPVKEIHVILERTGLSPPQKSLLYAELSAHLSYKEALSDQEAQDLLAAKIQLFKEAVPDKWKDPETELRMEEAFLKHQTKLREALTSGEKDAFINGILSSATSWKMQSQEPLEFISSEEPARIYRPFEGVVAIKGKGFPIPARLRMSTEFQKLFPNQTYVESGAQGEYTFTDNKGVLTRVFWDPQSAGKKLAIDQQINGKWYRHIPSESFIIQPIKSLFREEVQKVNYLLGSLYMTTEYTHWYELDNQTNLIFRNNEGLPVYQASTEAEESRIEVVRISDGAKLGDTGKFSPPFTDFEDPGFIEMWYKENHIKSISLPRFGLNFESDDNGRWLSKEHKGFHLVKEAHLSYLGSFSHTILLENEEGVKKVLIPDQRFYLPPLTKKEVLKPQFHMQRNLDQSTQRYQEFFLDSKGQLEAKNPVEALRLAEILVISQKYSSAALILEKVGQKLGLFDDGEQNALRTIMEQGNITGDLDANAIALRNYAGSLLVRNFQTYGKDQKLNPSDLQTIKDNYTEYLSRFGNITTGLRLTVPDELLLIRTLTQEKEVPLLATRLNELTKQESRIVGKAASSMPSKELKKLDLESLLNNELSDYNSTLSNQLLSRPWNTLTQRFPYFFKSAISDDPKRLNELKLQLSFLSNSQDDKDRALFALYSIIMKNRSIFLSFDKSYINKAGLFREVRSLLPDYLRSQLPLENPAEVIQEKTIKPKHPLLQKKEQLSLSYSIPADHESLSILCKECFSEAHKSKIDDKTFHEISAFLKDSDPLKTDFKAYKDMQTSLFRVKEGRLEDIKDAIQKNRVKEKQEQETLRSEIVEIANDLTRADNKMQTLIQLEREGGKRKLATFQDIMMSFGRQNTAVLQEFNPTLSSKEIENIYAKMGRFLQLATKEQQRERAKKTLKELELVQDMNEVAYFTTDYGSVRHKQVEAKLLKMNNQLGQKLALELNERAYEPQENPAALVFEYYANILIRKDQIAKLNAFMKSGDQNLIMEMIMGSGKSKVLLPLLGLLRAKGNDLSMLIVLPTQIAAVAADTQNILGEAFGQKLQSIPFDRNSEASPEALEDMIRQIKSIVDKQESLISTNKTIGCLLLKYIEIMSMGASKGQLTLMKEAINLLRKQGVPILDEVDTILNVMLELNFSMGTYVSPDPAEINVVNQIYSILYGDPNIKALGYLESDPNPAIGAPPLSEKVYHDVVKEKLALKFLQSLSTSSEEKVKEFMKGANESLLLHYLCRSPSHVQEAQAYYNAIKDPEIKNIFSLAGEEISHLLPHTLTRNCDEKYGFDPFSSELVAIPFIDAHAPNRGSQFASPHVTMNYTFQVVMKNGLPLDYLKRVIGILHGNALKELNDLDEHDITKTRSYKLFEKLKGDQNITMNMNDEMLQQFQKWINGSNERKLFFAENFILPSMKIYPEKLSWNPQNMATFFEKPGGVGGYTGTLWNSGSMHPQLKPAPTAGTDAKTFHILWEQSRNKTVTILKNDTQENYIKKMQSYDDIIDRGGLLKEKSNLAVAQEWSKQIDKPVVFYDKNGNQCITYKDEIKPLAKSPWGADKYVTFYDQVHTLGADIKQKGNAKGIVTIGRSLLKRDLFQAVWRFRELDKDQKVEFIMTEEVATLIRQKIGLKENEPITFEHIYTFASMNENEQILRDNFKALKQQIWNVPQQLLLKILLHEKVTEEQSMQALELLKSTWISRTYKSTAEMYGTIPIQEKSSKVIEGEAIKAENLLKEVFSKCSWLKDLDVNQKNFVDDLSAITKRKVALPEFVTYMEGDEDQAAEAQQEKEQEAEKEQEKESVQEILPERVELGRKLRTTLKEYPDWDKEFYDFFIRSIPCFPLGKYLLKDADKELLQFQDLFEGINISLNVPEWFVEQGKELGEMTPIKLLGKYRIPFQYVLIDDDKITLLSKYEADNEKKEKNPNLYNLALGYIQKPGKELTGPAREMIVKLKFLNGESVYSKAEQKILSEWINKHGKAKIKTLHKKILSGYPMKADQFQGSILQKLLSGK